MSEKKRLERILKRRKSEGNEYHLAALKRNAPIMEEKINKLWAKVLQHIDERMPSVLEKNKIH